MLKYRLITGSLLIIALLGMVALDEWVGVIGGPPGAVLFLVGLLAVALAGVEMAMVIERSGLRTNGVMTACAAMLGLTVMFLLPWAGDPWQAGALVASALAVVLALSLVVASRGQTVQDVPGAAGGALLAMVHLGLLPGFLLLLAHEHSAWWIVGVVLTTKSCDIGAYFTGRAIGRRKLIPWLSPGKTWEGTIGGAVTAILIGIAMAAASGLLASPTDHVPLWLGAVCGLAFGIVGQLGDLAMSLLKRGAGIKDSSAILPGMGGLLDVLDSLLFVAPVAYWLLMMFA